MIESIGGRIKELRKSLHMTQKQFSERIGITQAHLSAVENNKDKPSNAMLRVIHNEFDVSFRWLNHGEEPMFLLPVDTELLLSSMSEEQKRDQDLALNLQAIFQYQNLEIREGFKTLVHLYRDIVNSADKAPSGYTYLNICTFKKILINLLDCFSQCNEYLAYFEKNPSDVDLFASFGKISACIVECKHHTSQELDVYQQGILDHMK